MKDETRFKGLDRSVRLQKVIDTAAELFHKKGFKSATLEGLAQELGVSKAALYHYVSSKEHLLSMVYGQAFEMIFERVHEISAMDVAPDEKLRFLVRHHITHITIKHPALFSVFFAEENQLPAKDFEKIREEKRKYSQIIEDILKDGIAKGVFRPVNPRLQSNAILGMCNWVYKWYRPNMATHSPDQIADYFISLLETGYLAEKTPEKAGALALQVSTEPDLQPGTPEVKKQIHGKIKLLCCELLKLVEQIE